MVLRACGRPTEAQALPHDRLLMRLPPGEVMTTETYGCPAHDLDPCADCDAPTPPHYEDATITLHHGDCLDVLRAMPDASVDSVVTDPPYGLEFMGKQWDSFRKETTCASPTETAPTTTGTGAHGVSDAPNGTERAAPPVSTNGELADPARAASATVVDASAVGGFQDGAGGNAYSRSRVRTNTQRHGGDSAIANRRFGDWCEEWTVECFRVLKPGGHMLAFGGTRTWHRLACAVEDAGFEIRDSIAWMYGSGFPKSLDVSKAIDKAAGAQREVVGVSSVTGNRATPSSAVKNDTGMGAVGVGMVENLLTAPATDDARTWQGWGTALKPAFEPIVVARKPLAGTVAANVLAHGTGVLNIDGCRTGDDKVTTHSRGKATSFPKRPGETTVEESGRTQRQDQFERSERTGRWPANVVLDESQAAELDEQSGELASGANPTRRGSDKFLDAYGDFKGQEECTPARGADVGGASRFYYVAKADAGERVRVDGIAHPTVKPIALMRWLVRLVTPPGGIVLEPFAGSGTTVEACLLEGFRCIAIEREPTYLPLIVQRINRRRDPAAAVRAAGGEDAGLFDLLDGGAA